MKKIMLFAIFALSVNNLCTGDEVKEPTAPQVPNAPVVSGDDDLIVFPEVPALPSFQGVPPSAPAGTNQSNEPVREIERYGLTVTEAFPNGNTRRNVANTINNAQYILYSDGTVRLVLNFTNGVQYNYYLSNPGSRIELSPGNYRVTYDTIVQAGKEILLEQYRSELYNNENSITSISIMESNKTIVTMKFTKRL